MFIAEQEITLTHKTYLLFKDFYIISKNLPKAVRYSIGSKTEQSIIGIFDNINLALRLPKMSKESSLIRAGAHADTTRLLIRLLHELDLIQLKQYLKLQSDLEEILKMLGGWIKYLRV